MAGLTQLAPLGVPGRQYGDFDKTQSLPRDVDEITRLATCGAPGRWYGSFNRSPVTPPTPSPPSPMGGGGGAGRLRRTEDIRYEKLSPVPKKSKRLRQREEDLLILFNWDIALVEHILEEERRQLER